MKKDKYCMIPFMRYLEQANTQLQKIKWWIKEDVEMEWAVSI